MVGRGKYCSGLKKIAIVKKDNRIRVIVSLYIFTPTKYRSLVAQQKSKGHNSLFDWARNSNLAERITVQCLPPNSTDLQGVRCDDNSRRTLTILSHKLIKTRP